MAGTRWPESRAPRGMVATPHLLASQSGVGALRAGGNALDAAIAAATTIAVVYPHTNGVGGDNFWLIYDARARALKALCGAGRAAREASIEWYAARGVSGAIPTRGGLSALTVPGAVDGWWQAHQYSRAALASPIDWEDLLADAIAYARGGFTASAHLMRPPPREPDLFAADAPPDLKRGLWPLYHPDALARGPLVQTDLARTLEAIRDGGTDEFYRGAVAKEIGAAARASGSPLSEADLASHRSDWMEPLTIPYAGGQAASFPPPSQGMSALAMLAIAGRFDLAKREGNAVCLIQSLYFTWGSGLVAGDTGVVLQNRGSFFSLDAAHVNALVPGKRTMHTLTPSMYLEGGRPRFVYGTMGGEGQPQTQAALVTRRLHRGLSAQAAVEASRWLYGRTWGAPSRALNLEGRYPLELARDLVSRGHEVKMADEWDDLFGHAQCIWIDPDGGGFSGGSDPRADGGALGF